MMRTLAVLCALTLAACGSASSAGPKTSNPPLKTEPPKAKPDPAEKPPIEQDGLTLKLNQLACKITMTAAPWKGGSWVDQGGSAHLTLERPDLEGEIDMFGAVIPGESAKAIVDGQQAKMSQDKDFAPVSATLDEGHGRYALTAELNKDGKTTRLYLAVIPHPAIPDAYLVVMGRVSAPNADAFLKEVRTVLDTVAPL